MFTFNAERLAYDRVPDGKYGVKLVEVVDKSNLAVEGNNGSVLLYWVVEHPGEFCGTSIVDEMWLDPKFATQPWKVPQDSRRLKKLLKVLGVDPNAVGDPKKLVGSQVVMTVVNRMSKLERPFTNVVSYEEMPVASQAVSPVTRARPW